MIDRSERYSVFGTVLTLTAFAVSASIIPPLITTIAAEIGVDYNNFGYIIIFQFLSFFLAGISGGWIGERLNLNSRKLVSWGLLIVFITLFVAPLLKSLLHFMIWAIPLGFGGGLVETFGSVMISNHEKPNSSRLMNLSQVFYCLGAITAPQVVGLLLYMQIPWQMILVIFSIFILLIKCLFLFLTRNETPIESVPVSQQAPRAPLLKDKMFYLLAATLLLYVTFESVLACWVSVYFEKGLSCPPHISALRISVFWIGVIVGRLAISILPSRFSLWPALFAGVGLAITNAFLASLGFTPGIMTVLVFLIGVGAGPFWPTTVAICRVARNREKFTSSVIAVGAIGVVIGSFMGGAIFKYMGFNMFFPAIAIGFLLLVTVSYIAMVCMKQDVRST